MAITAELTPALIATLRQLRDLCDEPVSDDSDPPTRYDWLMPVAAQAGDANEHLRDHLVHEFDAGRPIDVVKLPRLCEAQHSRGYAYLQAMLSSSPCRSQVIVS